MCILYCKMFVVHRRYYLFLLHLNQYFSMYQQVLYSYYYTSKWTYSDYIQILSYRWFVNPAIGLSSFQLVLALSAKSRWISVVQTNTINEHTIKAVLITNKFKKRRLIQTNLPGRWEQKENASLKVACLWWSLLHGIISCTYSHVCVDTFHSWNGCSNESFIDETLLFIVEQHYKWGRENLFNYLL